MSKITNDGLTQSGTGCFMAVPINNSRRQKVNSMSWGPERRTAWTVVNCEQFQTVT